MWFRSRIQEGLSFFPWQNIKKWMCFGTCFHMFSDLGLARPVSLHRIIQVYSHIIPSLVFLFRKASALKVIKKMISTKVPAEEFVTGHTERIGWQSAVLTIYIGCFDATLWELGMLLNPLLPQVLQSWVKKILNVTWNFLLSGLESIHCPLLRKCPGIFSTLCGTLLPLHDSIHWIGNLGTMRNLESSVCPYLFLKSPCHICRIYSYFFWIILSNFRVMNIQAICLDRTMLFYSVSHHKIFLNCKVCMIFPCECFKYVKKKKDGKLQDRNWHLLSLSYPGEHFNKFYGAYS